VAPAGAAAPEDRAALPADPEAKGPMALEAPAGPRPIEADRMCCVAGKFARQ